MDKFVVAGRRHFSELQQPSLRLSIFAPDGWLAATKRTCARKTRGHGDGKISEHHWDTLASIGVKRVCGVPSDSLYGIIDSIRKHKAVTLVHMRNEEAAAFAAGAEARLTGNLVVCAGSSVPRSIIRGRRW